MNVVIHDDFEIKRIEVDFNKSELTVFSKLPNGTDTIFTDNVSVELAESIKRTIINYLSKGKNEFSKMLDNDMLF